MASMYVHQTRLGLACEPSAVRYAREHAMDISMRWELPRDVVSDAALIVDELVANAVRHTGGAAEPFDPAHGQPKVGWCSLTMWISSHQLAIAVYDESRNPPLLRPPSDDSEDGRGLHLVAGLTEGRWGFQLAVDRPGKLVWAKLQLPADASALGRASNGPSGGGHLQPLLREPARPGWRAVASA
ncbi:ATP-binding protein [Streptomyces sp. NPDC008139]|uniref:ATP-binding protein n=1 Tax=Streptomyces sp. NPDC008139 TaxID=3364814 RepID=UPI0036E6F0FB